jgi:hypothetical protein
MGMDLFDERGSDLRFPPSGWALALNLAEAYGWVPDGTTLPDAGEEEDIPGTGHYDTNDGQWVSAVDAAALADACERAITAGDYAAPLLAIDDQLFYSEPEPPRPNDPSKPPLPRRERISDEDMELFREQLEELMGFCREVSFQIG